MSSTTTDIPVTRYGVPGNAHQNENKPVKHGATLYGGAIAVTRAGYLVDPTTPTTADIVWGFNYRQVIDTGTADGAQLGEILTGSFFVRCATGVDALTVADVGATVYLVDNQTIGKTQQGTRPQAGTLKSIDTTRYGDQFAVTFGTPAGGTSEGP